MLYYIPNVVNKKTCIGNALSTINLSFTALDTNLYNLSTYTVNSVNFLSSTIISVSSTLNNRIQFLSASVDFLSAGIDFLSAGIQNVSSYVFNTLDPKVTAISAEYSTFSEYISYYLFLGYFDPVQYNTTANGQNLILNLNPFTNVIERQNAQISLNHNISLGDMVYAPNGLNGTISVFIGTAGRTITGYGPTWAFKGGTSALNTTLSARNLIKYYVDVVNNNRKILAELSTF
jgi:hypothetical protein